MLLGCNLKAGGFISISGIWGVATRNRIQGISPAFEDESSGTCFYFKDKGKNWKLFKGLCPELAEFEFWDENETRMGTIEQEKFLFDNGLSGSPYAEQIQRLDEAGLKEVDVSKSEGTNFPPSFMGQTYLYGTLNLSFPMPQELQIKYKQIITKESKP